MDTPRRVSNRPSTMAPPTPSRRGRQKRKSSVYCPSLDKLTRNFDYEFEKFLKSLSEKVKEYRKLSEECIMPLETQLQATHKRLRNKGLHLRSLCHWKKFYEELIKHEVAILGMFSLADFRPIDDVVTSLPAILKDFVRDNLKLWRDYMDKKKWRMDHIKADEALKAVEKEINEENRKNELIDKVYNFIEENGLLRGQNIEELDGPQLQEILNDFLMKGSEECSPLNGLPMITRKTNTRDWCDTHYGRSMTSRLKTLSEEEEDCSISSSVTQNDASSCKSMPSSNEEETLDINSFFTDC